jgi:hypothetical protein
MFPADRSWLVSSRWDDTWACIGGPEPLISDLLSDPVLAANARRVDTQQDATPPALGLASTRAPRFLISHPPRKNEN